MTTTAFSPAVPTPATPPASLSGEEIAALVAKGLAEYEVPAWLGGAGHVQHVRAFSATYRPASPMHLAYYLIPEE